MARRKILFGVGAGVLSLGVEGLHGLVTLALVLRYLVEAEAGYWALMATAGSFLLLLQFGLGPTVSRRVAVARTGGGDGGREELWGIIHAVNRALSMVLGLVIGVSAVVYLAYLGPVSERNGIQRLPSLAWFAYTAGVVLQLYGLSRLFVINGLGEVGWDKLLRAGSMGLGLLASVAVVVGGGGLWPLALVYLVQNAAFVGACAVLWRRFVPGRPAGVAVTGGDLRGMASEGGRLMALTLLGFVVTNAGLFIVERYYGVGEVPKLAALNRVATLVMSLGTLPPQMMYPYVAAAWKAGDHARCRRFYTRGILAAVGIFIGTGLPLLAGARWLMPAWLGEDNYLGFGVFASVMLFHLILVHQSAHATPVLAAVGHAFLGVGIVATIATCVLACLLPRWLGIIGIPVGLILGVLGPSSWIVRVAWRIFASVPGMPVPLRGQPT